MRWGEGFRHALNYCKYRYMHFNWSRIPLHLSIITGDKMMTTGALINFLGLTGCNWLLVRHFDLFNAFLQTKVLATTTLYLWARLPVSALWCKTFWRQRNRANLHFCSIYHRSSCNKTIICWRKSEWYLTILYNCQDKVGDYKKVFSLPSANDCRKQIRDRKGLAQGTEITLILKCKLQLLIASLHANGKSETMDGIF